MFYHQYFTKTEASRLKLGSFLSVDAKFGRMKSQKTVPDFSLRTLQIGFSNTFGREMVRVMSLDMYTVFSAAQSTDLIVSYCNSQYGTSIARLEDTPEMNLILG